MARTTRAKAAALAQKKEPTEKPADDEAAKESKNVEMAASKQDDKVTTKG